jgi:predicted transcriptional regulator
MSGSGCAKVTKNAGDASKQVLEVLAKFTAPGGAKDIAEAAGLEKKVVSNQISALKKQGLVESPVRCKYGITDEGKASLG